MQYGEGEELDKVPINSKLLNLPKKWNSYKFDVQKAKLGQWCKGPRS